VKEKIMAKNFIRKLPLMAVVVGLAAMVLAGCSTSTDPVETTNVETPNTDEPDVFVVDISEETDWNYMVVGKDGSSLFLDADEDTGIPTLAYLKPEKDSDIGLTYLFKENGLLDKIIANGYIVYFGNYNGYKFDVAVINPDDTIEYHYDIETDINWDEYDEVSPERTLSLGRSVQARSFWGDAWNFVKKNLGHALGVGSCVASIWAPPLAYGCATYIATTVGKVALEAIPADKIVKDVGNIIIDLGGCATIVTPNPLDFASAANSCISVLAGTADLLKNSDLDFANQRQPELAQADGVINGGRGDVKVTLSWNNLADVDLHVVDPYGEEIYYSHKNSVSGGALDIDNRHGYGPENIYWPARGAPTGTYEVYVHFYNTGTSGSSNSSSNYTVLINAFGSTRTYTGTVTANTSKVLVATFNSNGVITQARQVIVDMYDSSGDGWDHSGALRITVNGTNIPNVRLSSGSAGSHTFFADAGDVVNMYWTGNTGNYHKENAFVVYYAGTPPAPAFNQTGWSGSNALLFRVQNSLSNADLNQLLGSFTVTEPGASRAIFGQSRSVLPSELLPPKEELLPENYSDRH
jgi:hypothetical protein